jgi:hypothetical protein
VQVIDSPRASVAGCTGVQLSVPSNGSTTVTPVSVWLPVFVTTIWYSMMSPTALAIPSPALSTDVTVLTIERSGFCSIGTSSLDSSGSV